MATDTAIYTVLNLNISMKSMDIKTYDILVKNIQKNVQEPILDNADMNGRNKVLTNQDTQNGYKDEAKKTVITVLKTVLNSSLCYNIIFIVKAETMNVDNVNTKVVDIDIIINPQDALYTEEGIVLIKTVVLLFIPFDIIQVDIIDLNDYSNTDIIIHKIMTFHTVVL